MKFIDNSGKSGLQKKLKENSSHLQDTSRD